MPEDNHEVDDMTTTQIVVRCLLIALRQTIIVLIIAGVAGWLGFELGEDHESQKSQIVLASEAYKAVGYCSQHILLSDIEINKAFDIRVAHCADGEHIEL